MQKVKKKGGEGENSGQKVTFFMLPGAKKQRLKASFCSYRVENPKKSLFFNGRPGGKVVKNGTFLPKKGCLLWEKKCKKCSKMRFFAKKWCFLIKKGCFLTKNGVFFDQKRGFFGVFLTNFFDFGPDKNARGL